MATLEMATMQDPAAHWIDQRIIVGAVDLILEITTYPREGILQHADDMRGTADRVSILNATMRRPPLDPEVRSQASGNGLLTNMRFS